MPVFFDLESIDFWRTFHYILLAVIPLISARLLIYFWYYYQQSVYIKKIEWVLLEIKMPREILKSPQAMEVIFSSLHHNIEGTWYTRLTEGVVRHWVSLELVSLGGRVHFFIRVPVKSKNIAEASIYSQYPGVEIVEVDDYAKQISFGKRNNDWELEAFNFALIKEDPYPIKTYIDYGLDKNPKEEEKVDPMTPVIELLGSLKPGEQMWMQFLIMASKERFKKKGSWFKKIDWVKQGEELIAEKLKSYKATDKTSGDSNIMPPGEKKILETVQRSIGKLGFDCGFRSIYLAKKDLFDKVNFGAMASVIKQYNSSDLNGFKPLWSTAIKYPWQDVFGRRAAYKKYIMFDAFRRRSYFYPPYRYKPFVLNTEELATVYHFPGQVAETPTLGRIESKRSEPPANLPVSQ